MPKKLLLFILTTMVCTIFIGVSSTFAAIEKRKLESFDEIDLSGAGIVILSQGEKESLTVEADDNFIIQGVKP